MNQRRTHTQVGRTHLLRPPSSGPPLVELVEIRQRDDSDRSEVEADPAGTTNGRRA